jgi:hypothetical protein
MQEYLPFIIVTLGFISTTIFALFECCTSKRSRSGPSNLSGSSTPPLRFQSRASYGTRDDSPPTAMEGSAAPTAARKPILQPRFMTERLQASNNLLPTRQHKGSMGDQTRRTVRPRRCLRYVSIVHLRFVQTVLILLNLPVCHCSIFFLFSFTSC